LPNFVLAVLEFGIAGCTRCDIINLGWRHLKKLEMQKKAPNGDYALAMGGA
jgi:hypothetical protein